MLNICTMLHLRLYMKTYSIVRERPLCVIIILMISFNYLLKVCLSHLSSHLNVNQRFKNTKPGCVEGNEDDEQRVLWRSSTKSQYR